MHHKSKLNSLKGIEDFLESDLKKYTRIVQKIYNLYNNKKNNKK